MSQRSHAALGEVIVAQEVVTYGPSPTKVRNVVLLLAGSVALMMTGVGIIVPIFARRFEEMGGGVQALGVLIMAFALAQFIFGPIMGSLADRYGRRPFVLLSLGSFALANLGFLLASTIPGFIAVRAVEGALSAGLYPAAMGIVADVAPEKDRARWIGFVMAGYGAGFILGPVLGGFLYDWLGYAAPFIASALMAAMAFVLAFFMVPETRTPELRWREVLWKRRESDKAIVAKDTLWNSLPRPLPVFGVLLLCEFIMLFAFAFTEPQFVFFLYEDLNWTTVQFGVLVGVYGLSVFVGQLTLSRLSDRFPRKPIIVIGLLLNATFYAVLAFWPGFVLLLITAVISGLGEALVLPAVTAFVLDLTSAQHRSRVMGIKEAAAALGGVIGPLLVISVSAVTGARGVFIAAFVLILVVTAIAALDLRASCEGEECRGEAKAYAERRALVAQATLRGIVTSASAARKM